MGHVREKAAAKLRGRRHWRRHRSVVVSDKLALEMTWSKTQWQGRRLEWCKVGMVAAWFVWAQSGAVPRVIQMGWIQKGVWTGRDTCQLKAGSEDRAISPMKCQSMGIWSVSGNGRVKALRVHMLIIKRYFSLNHGWSQHRVQSPLIARLIHSPRSFASPPSLALRHSLTVFRLRTPSPASPSACVPLPTCLPLPRPPIVLRPTHIDPPPPCLSSSDPCLGRPASSHLPPGHLPCAQCFPPTTLLSPALPFSPHVSTHCVCPSFSTHSHFATD